MDAKIFGAFIAQCRKEKNMTQSDLAAKLNVTDKAVSRWERGIGFPDINTIEPLASALEISVLELIKSERITVNEVTKEEVTDIITDTLNVVKLQYKQERKNILSILGIILGIIIFILFLDTMQGRLDNLIFECIGIIFPLFCLLGFLFLFANGIRRKLTGKSCIQTFTAAFLLFFFLILLIGLFFFIGIFGIGPIPS